MEPIESSPPALQWEQLRDTGIAEIRAANQAGAHELLLEAASLNPHDVPTWL